MKKEMQELPDTYKMLSLDMPVLSKCSPLKVGLNVSVETVPSSPLDTPPIEWWMQDLNLTKRELKALESPSGWLTEGHVNAALIILNKQFSGINGFQIQCLHAPIALYTWVSSNPSNTKMCICLTTLELVKLYGLCLSSAAISSQE